jgi:putative transposase
MRRECLDHIILSERHLHRVLSSYFQYYRDARTHSTISSCTAILHRQYIIGLPEVGGLHHRYERRAAQDRRGGTLIVPPLSRQIEF